MSDALNATLRCMSSARSAANLIFAVISGLAHLDRSSYHPVSTIIARNARLSRRSAF